MKLPKPIAIAAVVALIAGYFLFERQKSSIEQSLAGPVVDAEIKRPALAPPEPGRGVPIELVESESERHAPEAVAKPNEPAPPTVRDEHPEENDELRGFRRKYESLGMNALEREQKELNVEIAELAAPEYDACIRRGEYEVLGKGTVYQPEKWDNERMTQIRMGSGEEGQTLAITLDERAHPDLYAKWREVLWMKKRLKELAELPPSDAPPPK